MIITDKNRIDNLAEELFDNISYRYELSEDDYRVVSRHSKEIKAAFFQSSWFTEEELLALREEVATLMTDDLQDMLLLVKFPPESIMLDYEEEVLALLEKALEIWNCINLVHMVWKNMVGQTGVSIFIVCGYGKQSAYATHRRWVKSVIRQLMTKLQVKGTMKQIVENYNYTPKSLKEHCPKLEMNPPEHARDVAWQIFMAICTKRHIMYTLRMFVGIVVPNPSSWLTPHQLGHDEFCVAEVDEWRSVLTAYEYFGVIPCGETDDEK